MRPRLSQRVTRKNIAYPPEPRVYSSRKNRDRWGCDLAVAEDGAFFAAPGVKIGLFCTTPAVPLVRAVGRKRALEMLFTGRMI